MDDQTLIQRLRDMVETQNTRIHQLEARCAQGQVWTSVDTGPLPKDGQFVLLAQILDGDEVSTAHATHEPNNSKRGGIDRWYSNDGWFWTDPQQFLEGIRRAAPSDKGGEG